MRALLFVCVVAARAAAQEHDAPPARALYLKHCAQCHGESGDGKGVTELEKPARSFQDGGFGYGNTPEALFRTLTFGIPGTPMPSFAGALTEAERKELAAYVITLGPPVVEVKRSETLLVVRDVPLFARGKLPPIVDGAPEIPRGLLVGTPDGFTFEYAVDDVRLLGVRQGAFVERRDWSGRGGDALLPLGKLVHLCGDRGAPGAEFLAECDDERGLVVLESRFHGTRARDDGAHVWRRLVGPGDHGSGRFEMLVDEIVRARSTSIGSGYSRSLAFDALDWPEKGGPRRLAWVAAHRTGAKLVAAGASWCVRSRPEGDVELEWLVNVGYADRFTSDGERVIVEMKPDVLERRRVEVVTLLLPAWTPDVEAAWKAELAR